MDLIFCAQKKLKKNAFDFLRHHKAEKEVFNFLWAKEDSKTMNYKPKKNGFNLLKAENAQKTWFFFYFKQKKLKKDILIFVFASWLYQRLQKSL